MKKLNKKFTMIICSAVLCVIMALSLCIGAIGIVNNKTVGAVDLTITGGKLEFNFDSESDLQYFDRYGEFGVLPEWKDGKVTFRTLEEQKLILKNYSFSDVEVTLDVITLSDSGKFDGGLYIQASNPANGMDKINAYNINIEHGVNSATYIVKLHQFSQAWAGIKAEKTGITLQGNVVKLKAVVKSGVLYVFADDMVNPIFNYNIGATAGTIGVRGFYSPMAIDNITIVSPTISNQDVTLVNKKNQAQNMVNSGAYTQTSVSLLNSAISLANSANTSAKIDEAISSLDLAMKKAVIKKTFTELSNLIAQANSITNSSKYTPNSYATFTAVLALAKKVTSSSSEHDISTWYNELSLAIDGLIAINV